MKSLVIGAAGFVGYYLIKELVNQGDEVFATKLSFENLDETLNCTTYDLDITNYNEVYKVINEIHPEAIYHLAAQSSVTTSWKKPQLTANINFIGTINVLEACREICPDSRILLVGSSEEYGSVNISNKINEDISLNPKNIYALTKAACESLAKIYVEAYNMNIMTTRSFNHIGPRQLPNFVIPDFCSQVAKIEKGLQEPIIRVGNLNSYRDFTDVRDIVNAYYMIVSKGISGETYNVGSGKALKIGDILDIILSNSTKEIKVEIDKNKFRPIDIPKVEADISKIKNLGWTPKYDVNDSIISILNYYREISF